MSKLFNRLLKARGLGFDFLSPRYDGLADPFILPDMDKAVARVRQAVDEREKILIYGDYDADGVTASTVMEETLRLAGVQPDNVTIMLPDRFADGYGMSPKLIKRATEQGVKLVITVDCGSRNHAIVEELNTLGIDTIITDHHETGTEMPTAVAILNPHRKDHPTLDLQCLAGVGVAFKLAQALVKEGMIRDGQEKWLLDLVIIGTICDSMLLTGENRILGFYGLKVLTKTRRLGLQELMRRAGVKNLHSEAIGFQIGPRLNAAGRLGTAELALNLLRASSPTEAATLAGQLEELNKKRKTEQISATREICERGVSDDPVIIETGCWHEGIIGIVAGRLVEEYQRPAFVLTEVADGVFKGSGRSFGDFNLAKALEFAKDSIIGGGGHAAAAGVRVARDCLYQFREQINEYYRSLHLKGQTKYLKRRPDITVDDFAELSLEFSNELKSLEPFGAGNEEPLFRLARTTIIGVRRMGADQNHLRLDLTDYNGKALKLIAFSAPEKWLTLTLGNKIEPIVRLTENDFNGIKSVEARIVDIDFPDC